MTKIYHFDSFWKRQEKYDLLNNTSFWEVDWKELELKEPYYFFVPKDFWLKEKYDEWFSISEIFKDFNSWIQTKNDKLSIQFTKKDLKNIVFNFQNLLEDELAKKYDLKNTSWWNILDAKNDLKKNNIIYTDILYRPFDLRNSLFTWKSSWFIWRPREKESKYMLQDNLSLFTTRTVPWNQEFNRVFVWKNISEIHIISDQTYFFPLYLYNQNSQKSFEGTSEKTPNFNFEIISKIEEKLKLKLNVDFTPENLFDYIYAVLHSKNYRETYKEFLKIDFPKVPFDIEKETFFKMVKLWEELRSYHLLENPNLTPKNFITKYEVAWENLVEKVRFENEKVFINDNQFFDWVSRDVWEFYIWGYMPAQKWLKDRKDRNLNYEDIIHYSKMILSLFETIRIMWKIEEVFEV